MSKIFLKTNESSPDVFSRKSFSVFHILSGSGTIKGSFKQDNGSAFSGVSVSFANYGSTVDNTTTDSSRDFSKSLNSLGIYTLTYRNKQFQCIQFLASIKTFQINKLFSPLTNASNLRNTIGISILGLTFFSFINFKTIE